MNINDMNATSEALAGGREVRHIGTHAPQPIEVKECRSVTPSPHGHILTPIPEDFTERRIVRRGRGRAARSVVVMVSKVKKCPTRISPGLSEGRRDAERAALEARDAQEAADMLGVVEGYSLTRGKA